MNVKKCTIDPVPEPLPPDPCKLQRIRLKEKAGVKFCPKPPEEVPPPPPECLALCIERIKNPPVGPSSEFPPVCRPNKIEPEEPIACTLRDRFSKDKKDVCKPKP